MKISPYRKFLKNTFALSKVTISLPVTLTALTGYMLGDPSITSELLYVCAGVYLLSSGSSAFNHFQDKETDALMERTRSRPIPSGEVSVKFVLFLSLIFVLTGSALLLITGWLPASLGMLAIAWYNGIYTPMKKITPMAAVPGAFIGAIPPFIGYTAAGGNLTVPAIWIAGLFFFVAQIPHFWLLAIYYADDYERSSLPVITQKFSSAGLRRITFVWLVSASLLGLALSLFGLISIPMLFLLNIIITLVMILSALRIFFNSSARTYRQVFMHFNFYVLGVIILMLFQVFYAQ